MAVTKFAGYRPNIAEIGTFESVSGRDLRTEAFCVSVREASNGDTDMTETDSTATPWRRYPPDSVATPIVQRVPYLELKLEHPDLEPSGHGEQFYPDALPYEIDGDRRVFYWRPTLESSTPDAADWVLACATTHELGGVKSVPASSPQLTTDAADGTVVVVDGTVAGDATTAKLGSCTVPNVRIEDAPSSTVELTANETTYTVPSGERREIELSQQQVDVHGGNGTTQTVTPVLTARYPGRREVHHPAQGAMYRLFPSFGLSLDEVPNPLTAPLTAGELDEKSLAEALGIDLSKRPYAERVLWQAFAHTVFSPHADAKPELTQLPQGHVVLRTSQ